MLLDLLGKGLNIVTKVLSSDNDVAEAVGKVRNAIATSDEAQTELKALEIQEMQVALAAESDVRKLYGIEAQSENRFVANARPAMLWLSGALIALNFGLLPLVNSLVQVFGGTPLVFTFPVLPQEIYWLIGSIFGLYTGARTIDKVKGR